ncbi:MAG: hypothetical protein COB76_01150 [Alphaproteobacteria bacterium]|nr:MAG: hypothetical protein COB76_01150 [Alphaproteobacteria bacterium]
MRDKLSMDSIEDRLTKSAKIKLRLCKIFKTASAVNYDDVFQHKWKIPFYVFPSFGIGTVIMLATFAYYAAGTTEESKKSWTQITNSFSKPIHYALYEDFMVANKKNPEKMDVHAGKLSLYTTQWTLKYLQSRLHIETTLMEDGNFKNILKRSPLLRGLNVSPLL